MARIEESLRSTAFVLARRALSLCQIAARTTKRQVAQHGLATARPGQEVFDMECNPRRCLKQSAIFAGAAGAGLDKVPIGLGLGHVLALRVLRPNPNGNGYGSGGGRHGFALGKLGQAPAIRDHPALRFGNQLPKRCLLLRCNGSFTVFFKQPVEPPLFGGGKLLHFRRHRFLHRSRSPSLSWFGLRRSWALVPWLAGDAGVPPAPGHR